MYKIVVEIPEGWGAILLVKNGNSREGRGAYVKFPPWWGYRYFLELHNVYSSKAFLWIWRQSSEANYAPLLTFFQSMMCINTLMLQVKMKFRLKLNSFVS